MYKKNVVYQTYRGSGSRDAERERERERRGKRESKGERERRRQRERRASGKGERESEGERGERGREGERDRDRVAVLAGTAGVRELELVAREFAPRDTHVHLREHRRDRLSNSIYVVYISALTPI